MTSSQPQAVAVLRDKLEAMYQADAQASSEDMSKIQKEGVDLWTELMKVKEAKNPPKEDGGEREEKGSLQGWSLVETHYTESSLSSTNTVDRLEAASNITVREEVVCTH